jgi:hypothetical protein
MEGDTSLEGRDWGGHIRWVGSTSSVGFVVNHDGGTSLEGGECIMWGVHHGGWYIIGGCGEHHGGDTSLVGKEYILVEVNHWWVGNTSWWGKSVVGRSTSCWWYIVGKKDRI